jgi:PiT family inorganic phosphate transporter
MTLLVLLFSVLFLAYTNGANDNFKGVATLYGSGTTTYRKAIVWTTVATLAGSLTSVALAHGLVKAFSGKGLIDTAAFDPAMLTAIGLAAAVTILLATVLGMPTSTTHALTGALVGVGMVGSPMGIHWGVLGTRFAQPLLLSPVLAIAATAVIYPLFRRLRQASGVCSRTCVCVGSVAPQPATIMPDGSAVLATSSSDKQLVLSIDEIDRCVERYEGRCLGVAAQPAVDAAHWLSSGAVCFARAVNDTPKMAALLLVSGAAWVHGNTPAVLLLVTVAVVLGGAIQSRKVAQTMSRRITDLNTGQGLTANLITAAMVIGASRMGVPVSTTHVSCGSIFGISAINGKRNWSTIAGILVTWVTTLPLAVLLGMVFYWMAANLPSH